MKTAFLHFIFIIAATAGFGQYQSFFGEETTGWNLKNSIFTEEGGSIDSLAYLGDTLFAEDTYRRYARWSYAASFDPDEEPPPSTTFELSDSEFWLRESADASLFYIGTFTEGEAPEINLACNMNLELGQTFEGVPVSEVYTDTEGRKVISMQDGAIEFIEGVGPIPFLIQNSLSGIICQTKDGELNYLTPEAEYTVFCLADTLSVNVNDTDRLGFEMFPNPATVSVTVQSPDASNGNYTLYDLLGNAVLRGNVSGGLAELSIAHLPKGMYLLRYEAAGESAVKKLAVR